LRISAEELTKNGIGRYIHLDTDNIVGTNFDNTTLNHIDLVVNYYDANIFKERCNVRLDKREKIKASRRIHLYKTYNVPFKSLFEFAWCFFQSTTLVEEWCNDQFRQISVDRSLSVIKM